jgi:hypothetical protein
MSTHFCTTCEQWLSPSEVFIHKDLHRQHRIKDVEKEFVTEDVSDKGGEAA